MATQPSPAAIEGRVITRRPDRGLHVTSAPGGTIVSASAYTTRRQKQLILNAMPAHTIHRLHKTPFDLFWCAAISTSPFSLFSVHTILIMLLLLLLTLSVGLGSPTSACVVRNGM